LATVKAVAARPGGLALSLTRAKAFFPTAAAAFGAAKRVVADLKESDFVETLLQNPDLCDVYAVVTGGAGWYVKLTMRVEEATGDVVMLISFHPLARPIRKANGHEVKP
jgi:hypothetical protein